MISFYLKFVTIAMILMLWPLNILLKNGILEFLYYASPVIFIFSSFLLYSKKNVYWPLLLIPIAFINTALLFFPSLVSLLNFIFLSRTKLALFILLFSLLTTVLGLSTFFSKSIFVDDYQERQSVIRKGQLYPTVWLARLFQNKPSIYLERYEFNLTALTDPNNYFFGFHPREIVTNNQNLIKFPFLSIVFFLMGLYYLGKNIYFRRKELAHWKFLVVVIISLIFCLSLLTSFDKHDFVLFIPLSIIMFTGFNIFIKNLNNSKKICLSIFLIFGFLEYIQLFIRSLLGTL